MVQNTQARFAIAALVGLAAVGVSETAEAKPKILTPSTRPHFFAGGVGANFYGLTKRCRGAFRNGFGCSRASAKVVLEYGYHFSGKFEGAAIGAAIDQTFDDFLYTFNPAFKFWYDIEIADMAIYITPWAKAGYLLGSDFFGNGSNLIHGFNIGAGVEGRVILNNRGLLFLRPLHLDTYLGSFGGESFILNYAAVVGGGVVWD